MFTEDTRKTQFQKQRFQRDYSFNGFGGRIDDALSSLFPCYPSANRRLLQNLQKAAELPEIQHPPKIVRINEELQTIPPETPQNQAQDEVLPAVKANTNSILKNGYHHHNNHSSSNHHTTTTNGFKPKPKLPNGEMLIRQRSHA
jgi:hypothetical protein